MSKNKEQRINVVGCSCDYIFGFGCAELCEPSSAPKGAGDRLRERVGGGGVSNYADTNEKIKTYNSKLL